MKVVVLLAVLGVLVGCTQKQVNALNRSYERANASGVPNTTYRQTLENTKIESPEYGQDDVEINTQQGAWGLQPQTQNKQTHCDVTDSFTVICY